MNILKNNLEPAGLPIGIKLTQETQPEYKKLLDHGCLCFLVELARSFEPERQELLAERKEHLQYLQSRTFHTFPQKTGSIRALDWTVRKPPSDLQTRRVEMTGPITKKTLINGLNSGADAFMADFEDATSPHWENIIEGQLNLYNAVRKQLTYSDPHTQKQYEIKENPSTLIVRPRGLHMDEKHLIVDGHSLAASLFDFGVYIYHNTDCLLANNSGPYFYLPKIERAAEAAWWADVFQKTEHMLHLKSGTICATLLIETFPAALELEEILYQLKNYAIGLNSGRWDYIFSYIKTFSQNSEFVLPERNTLTMQTGFMDAYARHIISVCQKRKAYPIGGMSAFIPVKNNPEKNKNAYKQVKKDKNQERKTGFHGAWVAHPGLVETVRNIFDQKPVNDSIKDIAAQELIQIFDCPEITEQGLKQNIRSSVSYMHNWIKGIGAVAIDHIMEDLATAEIARSQLWQWRRYQTKLDTGHIISDQMLNSLFTNLVDEYAQHHTDDSFKEYQSALQVIKNVVFCENFIPFLSTYIENDISGYIQIK